MTAADHHDLITRFDTAFQKRDAATMAACYAPQATFRDPVFTLQGAQVGAMWRMLCARGTDLRIEFANVSAGESVGGADWQAWYAFSATGRQVHNVIHAAFRFADGLIVEHIDTFDFWRWSRQALGPPGVLLGWTPWLHGKVRRDAARALERFMASAG
jgi:hypothetical protein